MAATLSRDAAPAPARRAPHPRPRCRRRTTGWCRPERHRVLERQRPEVGLGGVAVLDQLPRLGQHLADVGHVPVPDVGREQRLQPRHRPGCGGCRTRARSSGRRPRTRSGTAVVNTSRMSSASRMPQRGELVERRRVLVGEAEHAQAVVEPVEPLAVARAMPYCSNSIGELAAVEVRGVVVLDRVAVALLPVADEVGVQRRGPRDAALLEREPQRAGTAGARRRGTATARAARRAIGEHPDVVEHVVADRLRGSSTPSAAVWNVGDTPSSTHRCHTGS